MGFASRCQLQGPAARGRLLPAGEIRTQESLRHGKGEASRADRDAAATPVDEHARGVCGVEEGPGLRLPEHAEEALRLPVRRFACRTVSTRIGCALFLPLPPLRLGLLRR
jgi:hypothetical protein